MSWKDRWDAVEAVTTSVLPLTTNTLDDKVDSIVSKCDAIIAEQAAVRLDLTTALIAIWNKVKDL